LKIILLPGMDGTGHLFSALIAHLPHDIQIDVICLNEIEGVSFQAQAREISHKIGAEAIFLVAESYSGRIAYELCGLLGHQIRTVVFVASFITAPGWLSKLAAFIPQKLLNISYIPNVFFNYLCFSGFGNDKSIYSVRKSVGSVSRTLIKQRLINMAKLQIPHLAYNLNAIYIRPTCDRLVSVNALNDVRKIFRNLQVQTVIGGHFIAQSNPEECAKIILSAFALFLPTRK
jgi:pimeloyl-ACP methyl ester carboxylesterase